MSLPYSINRNQQTKSSRRVPGASLALAAICVLFVLIVAFVLLEVTGKLHIFNHSNVPTTTKDGGSINNQKGEPQTDNTTGNGTANQPGDSKSNSSTGANTTIIAPTGDFVSAHHVNLATPISSVCNTTPGATCVIRFVSGTTVKNLPAETTDRGGSAYWNAWTPTSIGLTPGTWQIQALANQSGQTKTSSDAMDLVVQQ